MNDTKKDTIDTRRFQEVYFDSKNYTEMQLEHIEKVKRGEVPGETYVGDLNTSNE